MMLMLSVVTTLYRSSRYVDAFYRRIVADAEKLTSSFEIVFVNDASPDDSLEMARRLCATDPRVKVIDLARNFGQHRALMCGMRHAGGERVFVIDVDLEEEPENLGRFWRAMDEDCETDVVVGQLEEKTLPFAKAFTSDLFYKVFNAFSPVQISDRDIVSRLMKRSYADALLQYGETELFLPAVWKDAGFVQKRIVATKVYDGNSSYTFRKKLVMAADAITSFSSRPLTGIFYLGLLSSGTATLVILYLVLQKLFWGRVFVGWTSLMAALFLIGGVIIFSIGVVGIYIAKIFSEVKGRPTSLVRAIYQGNCVRAPRAADDSRREHEWQG
ncbi:glycosyltransferase family 2 protein [Paraburkholderia kirstenboschensis]|uniref:Glycosyltransferase family 2 protein n=1 Tax=Paraburkholderia kirstenboschensis TaxID=1245436 RepID=A0ABZ0EPN1_9BURK|nr:glycosyltransferase family 2 protein [Paraburkholderia kirstenboschensis]WOD18650.1 glycosyltransferase family 2 protein [Paraburkholderia kirstenboschensis]